MWAHQNPHTLLSEFRPILPTDSNLAQNALIPHNSAILLLGICPKGILRSIMGLSEDVSCNVIGGGSWRPLGHPSSGDWKLKHCEYASWDTRQQLEATD